MGFDKIVFKLSGSGQFENMAIRFLVVQKDVAAFGGGDTPEEAFLDALDWIDRDHCIHMSSCADLADYQAALTGELCIVNTDDLPNNIRSMYIRSLFL